MAQYEVNGKIHELSADERAVLDRLGVKYQPRKQISVAASAGFGDYRLTATPHNRTWLIEIEGFTNPSNIIYMSSTQIVKFAREIIQASGSRADVAPLVVRSGDSEPPRDAVYVDKERDVWSYDHEVGAWGYTVYDSSGAVSAAWTAAGPWRDAYDFPWTLKTRE